MWKNPLFDLEFLNNLFLKNEREIYARITALNLNEEPIEYIEGKISDGSINIDGNSSVRRSCSLTMTAQEININEFYWGIKNKFKLEIGLKNNINLNYPEIIWFKQGIFVITEFNTNLSTNKWDIKIQGRDKMCLLNGDVSGNFMVNTNLGQYEDAETKKKVDLPLKEILYSIICVHGKELLSNVIINDLEEIGKFVQVYNRTEDAYLYRDAKSDEFKNLLLNGNSKCYYQIRPIYSKKEYLNIPKKYEFLKEYFIYDETKDHYKFSNSNLNSNYFKQYKDGSYWFEGCLEDDFNIIYDDMVTSLAGIEETPTIIKFGLDIDNNNNNSTSPADNNYYLAKISTGDLVGYKLTELTYPGDFIMSVGETLTSALDKIKSMLGDFEYFYDIDGKFVFQRIKDSIDTPWNSVRQDETIQYSDALVSSNTCAFSFVNGKLISSFQNNPKIAEIKNDYVVWGKYNVSGMEIPIHMRYAIDVKPTRYQPIRPLKEEVITVLQASNGEILNNNISYNYYDAPNKEPYDDSKLKKITTFNESMWGQTMQQFSVYTTEGNKLTTTIYPYFATEPYTAEQFDWRELIYQMALDSRRLKTNDDFLYYIAQANPWFSTGYTGYEQYYTDLEGFWRTLYDPNPEQLYTEIKAENITDIDNLYIQNYYREIEYEDFDNLTYENLYVFNRVKHYNDENSEYEFIYPFINSDVGSLKINTRYFLSKDGEWKPFSTQALSNKMSKDTYENYKILNETSFKNIYIKNVQEFRVKTQDGHITYGIPTVRDSVANQYFYVPYYETESKLSTYENEETKDYLIVIEKQFEQVINYLKDLNSLMGILTVLSPYGFVTSETYTLLYDTIKNSNLNNKTILMENIRNSYFTEYNAIDCNTFLQNLSDPIAVEEIINNISDPILQEEVSFAIQEKLLYPDFDIEEDKYYYQCIQTHEIINQLKEKIHDLYSKYCIKDSGYCKFNDLSQKIQRYYKTSNLDAYHFSTRPFLYNTEKITLSDIPKQKINYILDYIKELMTYLKNLDVIATDDIKTVITNEILRIIESYSNIIINNFNNWIESTIMGWQAAPRIQFSCLPSIRDDLISAINLDLEPYYNQSENFDYNDCITVINNINNAYSIAVDDIIHGYNDNKEIIQVFADINTAKEANNLTLEKLVKLFNDQLDYLNQLTEPSTQSRCSIDALTDYLKRLSNVLEEDSEIRVNETVQMFEEELYTYILSLKHYIGATESSEEDLEYNDDINFNLRDTVQQLRDLFIDFDSFSRSLGELRNLKMIQEWSMDNIEPYLIFRRPASLQKVIILSELYESAYRAKSDSEREQLILNYIDSMTTFQLNLIREDNNHFNHYSSYLDEKTHDLIESMRIISEPINYYSGYYIFNTDNENNNFWTLDLSNPHLLVFWFDFLDPDNSELAQYSVPAIGTRTKATREESISAIHYQDVPNVIFTENKDNFERQQGYLYVNINEASQTFFKNYQINTSAKSKIDRLLYQHSYCTQNVSLQAVPVYHLQPNNKIHIRDDKSKINGEYIVNKITIPLNFKKLMTINATKIIPNIN